MVDAPPTIEISCPDPAAGWAATAVPTQFVADEVGYHMWWRLDPAGSWIYWGTFKSGVSTVAKLGGLSSASTFEVRYDREMLSDPSSAAGQLSFVVPEGC